MQNEYGTVYSATYRSHKAKKDATKRCMAALSADDGVVVANVDLGYIASYLHRAVWG